MAEAPSVTIRARTDDDLDMLFALAADLDSWEQRNASPPGALIRSVWQTRFEHQDQEAEANGTVRFVIEADGEAVGSVGLFSADALAHHAEVGIALVAAARGRGVGSAAIAQIVEFGFVRRNLRRLHLEVIASNAAAIRTYEKAGFVHEGRSREHAWVRGHYEDIVRMGLLRSEWRADR